MLKLFISELPIILANFFHIQKFVCRTLVDGHKHKICRASLSHQEFSLEILRLL